MGKVPPGEFAVFSPDILGFSHARLLHRLQTIEQVHYPLYTSHCHAYNREMQESVGEGIIAISMVELSWVRKQ